MFLAFKTTTQFLWQCPADMLHMPVRLIRRMIQWIIHWTLVVFTAGNIQPQGEQMLLLVWCLC